MSFYQANFLMRELAYNGHLQSLGAAAIAYITAATLRLPVTAGMLLIPYLLFQAIYYFDRYYDASRDEKTNVIRTRHIRQYFRFIPVLISSYLLSGLLVSLAAGTVFSTLFYVVASVFGMLYPVLFKPLTVHIPLFKNFYVGLVFALMVAFPFIYIGSLVSAPSSAVILLLFVFFETFISQIALDIKDEKSDRRRKLKTLAAMIGGESARKALLLLSAVVAFGVVLSATVLSSPYQITLLALATLAFNLYLIKLLEQKADIAFIAAAGKYLIWPVLVLLLPQL